jgi:hypothetical protein
MTRTTTRISLFGLFLVVFGVLMLLRKGGIINLHAPEIIWPVLTLFGLILAGRGLADGRRGKIVGGTVLFLYSIFFLVRSAGDHELPMELIVPSTFLIFGIVVLMLFVNRPAEWYFLVPGALLLLVGCSFLMTQYGSWYGWQVRDAISTWWPLALVLMGAGMLLRRRAASSRGDAGPGPSGFDGGSAGFGPGAPPPQPPATGTGGIA